MQKLLCYVVPSSIPDHSDDEDRSRVVRRHLAAALSAGIQPEALPNTAVRIAVGFDQATMTVLKRIADDKGLAPGRVVGGLLKALHRSAPANSTEPAPVLKGLRSQQAQVVVEAAPHLKASRCILSEVGTGVGKSILIAHLAAYVVALRDSGHKFEVGEVDEQKWLAKLQGVDSPANRALLNFDKKFGDDLYSAEPPRCVIVASPTVKDLVHLVSEYRYSVTEHAIDPGHACKTAVVLGRAQFASASAVRDLLASQVEPDLGVQEWLTRGMPAGSTEYTRKLLQICPGISGLMDDLRALATNFPVEDASLSAASSDEDQASYEALRIVAAESDILFVTHAMLCIDNMHLHHRNAPMLPRPLALFVDEAHLLEQNQAAAASKGLSLTSLMHTLRTSDWTSGRCKGAADEACATAVRLNASLRRIPDDIQQFNAITDPVLASRWQAAQLELVMLRDDLSTLRKKLAKCPPALQRSASVISAAHQTLEAVLTNHFGSLTFSPTKRYPLLTTGPKIVDKYLAVRWATTPAVMLLSGTLLYPGEQGPSAASIIRELALPVENTVTTAPCQPHWLRSIPTLHTPAPEMVRSFTPPDSKLYTPELLEQWLTHVADLVEQVSTRAVGGTLVLMTGYERLAVLGKILEPRLGDRLIIQQRNALPLYRAQVLFEAMSRARKNPVWIATGGGWTGLDITDKDVPKDRPQDDILLTDLVIPALPFGMNHTLTHASRVAFNFVSELAATARLLRQAMGRLVRRDGVRDRHIWILDGRLFQPNLNYASRFRKLINEYYEKQERFTI